MPQARSGKLMIIIEILVVLLVLYLLMWLVVGVFMGVGGLLLSGSSQPAGYFDIKWKEDCDRSRRNRFRALFAVLLAFASAGLISTLGTSGWLFSVPFLILTVVFYQLIKIIGQWLRREG
jgi:hypothetical protein